MTPRKELFIKVKEELANIPELELIDLQRQQFGNGKENYPAYYTAALIEIRSITWTLMVEQKQEGKCVVAVTFYCKDGWMEHFYSSDPENALIEIDILDKIVEQLQNFQGEQFKPLNHVNEEPGEKGEEIMSYTLLFETSIYRSVNSKYTYIKNLNASVIF
ncbi:MULTISPECIES: hypothetical protein [Flavobacterium]|uniref:Uncharacterized protein n=1 Tax=Flavobacterium chungangense TaxID=554283 RepID=A0A6V6YYV6_9FLAO|nr:MULTISPECIES: hypothetical protein [Flavobacterium]OOV19105.1 hypothetical protein BXU10_05390 [Flavobacterium sp. LM4]CAD0004434.1 hypothetical protein FLACHUCJ7_01859 [Flavobacterium chungangense]